MTRRSTLEVRYGPAAPTRKEILAKAMDALAAKRISGHEATKVELALNANRLPDQVLLEQIFGGPEPLRKAFSGSGWQPVTGVRHAGAFDRLVRQIADWQRSQRGSR